MLLSKAISDESSLSDSQALDIEKALSDALYATDDVDGEASIDDDQELHVIKQRTDRSVITEVLVRVVSYFREFVESPGVTVRPS